MRRLGFVCAVVLGLGVGGCGDSNEDQCKDLFEAVCSKLAECAGSLGADLKDQCLKNSDQACENAGDPKGDVDACIDAINDASCTDFNESSLPNACDAD